MPAIRYAFWAIERFGLKYEMERTAVHRGMDLVIRHYYSPVPELEDFGEGFWDEHSALPGIEISDAVGLDLLENVFPNYLGEFRERYPDTRPDDAFQGFYLVNGVYMAVDAHAYYAMIRYLKPARIIEIGAGMSTQLAVDAASQNAVEGNACTVSAIEPYPSDFLRSISGIELIESKLQDVDLALFSELTANDILFIDSTHVLREGNDVQLEYLELLPRLADGVYVNIHDISLPKRYPKDYFEAGWYWNEQYLLQAFLAFNDRFDVVWPGNYMMINHAEKMVSVFPEITGMRKQFPRSEPTAFWIRTRDD